MATVGKRKEGARASVTNAVHVLELVIKEKKGRTHTSRRKRRGKGAFLSSEKSDGGQKKSSNSISIRG